MSNLPVRPSTIRKAPVAAWRIVGGAFLHFAVPVYVVAVALVTLFTAPAAASIADLARSALGYSGWFLASYAALAVSATLAAAIAGAAIDSLPGRHHDRANDADSAALESRLRVTQALAEVRALPGADVARLADSIGGRRWDHDDSRFQTLSQDLLQVVQAMTAANATASVKSRPELVELATRSLQRIDQALGALVEERSRLDHGDAHAIARYVENRYGPSDFAGS